MLRPLTSARIVNACEACDGLGYLGHAHPGRGDAPSESGCLCDSGPHPECSACEGEGTVEVCWMCLACPPHPLSDGVCCPSCEAAQSQRWPATVAAGGR